MISRWRKYWELLPRWKRRSVHDRKIFPWHLGLVPDSITIRDSQYKHPASHSAVFVVHGIGQQELTETASVLRSGFDDALVGIEKWQIWHDKRTISDDECVPPPYILDGHWANYSDIEATFKSYWEEFDDEAQKFFRNLWKRRIQSTGRTYRWFLVQQLRLLNPKVAYDVGLFAWLLYWPFQITSFITLTMALLLRPKIVSGFLADVRLYADPQGVTERAIVQQIDNRVGKRFLQMIGLDWNFLPLQEDSDKLLFKGKPLEFDRLVWVAHSLGTVISYNVLSDLFHKAKEIESLETVNDDQLAGIKKFRSALRRFVTLGSPLDKIAYLFGRRAVRPWPSGPRQELLDGGEGKSREWWVNFYHLLDPVSGSLESELICGASAPLNEHIGLFHLPGWAHVAYWTDTEPLRYILSRTYGKLMLEDKSPYRLPGILLSATAVVLGLLQAAVPALLVGAALDYFGVISMSELATSTWRFLVSVWDATMN